MMKSNSAIFLAVGLAAGFAFAWVLKPAPKTIIQDPPDVSSRTKGSDSPFKVSDRPSGDPADPGTKLLGKKPSDAEIAAEEKESNERFSGQQDERMRGEDEQRIKKLSSALDLAPWQVEKLGKYLNDRRAKVAEISRNYDDTTFDKVTEILDPKHFDSMLKELLTPEQAELYLENKNKELGGKVDSASLAKLAAFNSAVDLRPEQRDAIYEVLYADAASQVDKKAESDRKNGLDSYPGAFDPSEYTDGRDIFDFSDSGEITRIYDSAGDDPESIKKGIKALVDQRIEERLGRFSGILDQSQLDQYRADLKKKANIIYGGMLGTR
jgi:hypothetical protein